MRLRVTYDPEAGCAYAYIGARRRVKRTVELDEDTMADYDENDQIIGIEFIGVSTPEFELLSAEFRRAQEDVKVKGEVL